MSISQQNTKKSSNSILDKCYSFTKAQEVREQGYYPYFIPIESEQDTEVMIKGKRFLMLGSNSYLGLTNHPKVKEAAIEAIKKYGTGCAGSRFLNGSLDLHEKLEHKLAEFIEKESAVVFSTGFQTNLGTISALSTKDDYVIIDKIDHASIIDGTRLGFGKTIKYQHNDMEDLERVLQTCGDSGKLIIVDGIFSMHGDIADLPGIVKLAKEYGANVMVDDAHAIGVLGEKGNGTSAYFGLGDEVDIIMGTFSKSLAAIGGFIAADSEVIDYIKHHARALIFSASIAPPCAAAVCAALDIIINEPERREKLWHNAHKMLDGFKRMGFNTGASETPIIPLIIGDDMKAFQLWRTLYENCIFVNAVVYPAVSPGNALMRISVMATHTDKQLDRALENIEKIGKELEII